jgi:hypothetical protein
MWSLWTTPYAPPCPEPTSQDAKPRAQPGVWPPLYNKCGGEPRVKPVVWRPEMWALNVSWYVLYRYIQYSCSTSTLPFFDHLSLLLDFSIDPLNIFLFCPTSTLTLWTLFLEHNIYPLNTFPLCSTFSIPFEHLSLLLDLSLPFEHLSLLLDLSLPFEHLSLLLDLFYPLWTPFTFLDLSLTLNLNNFLLCLTYCILYWKPFARHLHCRSWIRFFLCSTFTSTFTLWAPFPFGWCWWDCRCSWPRCRWRTGASSHTNSNTLLEKFRVEKMSHIFYFPNVFQTLYYYYLHTVKKSRTNKEFNNGSF